MKGQRHLTDDQHAELEAVIRAHDAEIGARQQAAKAAQRTTQALRQAIEAGVPVQRLARETGIPRMSLLRRTGVYREPDRAARPPRQSSSARDVGKRPGARPPMEVPMSGNADRSHEREATTRDAELNRQMDVAGFPTLDELALASEHGQEIPWPAEGRETQS